MKKIFLLDYLVSIIIIWNYGVPDATPFQDVAVAVILSIIFILIKRLKFKMEKLVILSNEKASKK